MKYTAENLGNKSFKQSYGTSYAYAAGAMYKAIASKELVVRMGQAGYLSFYGSGGVSFEQLEQDIQYIQTHLNDGQPYGMNLICTPTEPEHERKVIELFMRYNIKVIEASAFMQVTPALVLFRLKGLRKGVDGQVISDHKIMAKISRPEVASAFLSPAPDQIVESLLSAGAISSEQAELSRSISMADDLCTEADSGGHTDMGVMATLLPSIIRLRNEMAASYPFASKVRVGAAGGIGTPEPAAAAFAMGADFILTGSINQCTVEAGTSDKAKDMLQQLNIQDTDYAPAGDMFELGAKVQVMRRGVFFPVRANKLYDLWRTHNSLDEISAKDRKQIEEKFFGRSFEEVYAETRDYYLRKAPAEIEKAEKNPKHKMALVFRWYFVHSTRLAMRGDQSRSVDFQIHTGPALGAFNQWVKDTELQEWRNRHADILAIRILQGAADILNGLIATTEQVNSQPIVESV
ncbi:PfaD family polyunsaturated fatty acid/polyketide biosynthesis protein [Gynuella sunshinyii]|uniref:Dioxygenases-like 2-nitropropane dioxygenase n=1 Tax=Gynuella sunshinyii YC6258 TaxID=1445510 RepID=A0A0C5VQM7_9GAMM|nr:PfaD family polyunsaturated fatty acid/polyketide biosynthesis protein [Gynuella sunshinyii]AJQ95703.1 dioxygenases-like 2-nitropropane dioxygenase [Gynuella sunshinyii YC6258]